MHARTRTHTHTLTHARTRAHTHSHTCARMHTLTQASRQRPFFSRLHTHWITHIKYNNTDLVCGIGKWERERERWFATARWRQRETEKAEDHVVCCSSWKALHCKDKGGENPKIMRIADVRTWTPATISPSLSSPSGFRSFSFWHRFASLGGKEKKKKRIAWRCFVLVSTFALFFTTSCVRDFSVCLRIWAPKSPVRF